MQSDSTPFKYSVSYDFTIGCLKWIGLHRNDEHPNKNFRYPKAVTSFCLSTIAIVILSWSAYESIQKDLIPEALTLFGGTIIYQFHCIKIIVCWWKSNALVQLFQEMEALTNDCPKDTPATEKLVKSCINLTTKLSKLWIGTLHFIMITYPLIWITVLLVNLTRGFYEPTFLLVKFLLPGNRQIMTPYNELLNLFMTASIYFLVKGYSGWNALIFSYLIFVKCQFDAISSKTMDLFVDLDPENYEEALTERLVTLVKWHQRVIEFAKLVECTLSVYIAMFQVSVGLVICICVLTVVNILENGRGEMLGFLILPGAVLLIFAFCKLGHEISDSSSKVGEAIYNANWELYPSARVRRTMMIIMLRTQRPVQMTAADIFVLNLPTFSTIIKSAYTYYTFLRKT